MKTRPLRRTQGERREEAELRLLEAGTRLVAERGLQHVTLAEVGASAGFSRGLPAHYFGNKQGFEEALADFIVEESRGLIAGTPREGGLSALIDAVTAYFDAAVRCPHHLCVLQIMLTEALSSPSLSPAVTLLSRETASAFEGYFRKGVENGEIRADLDPTLLGVILLAALRGVIAQWQADRTLDLARAREQLIGLLLQGVAAGKAPRAFARPPAGKRRTASIGAAA